MKTEKLANVDYKHFMDDIIRVSHETKVLADMNNIETTRPGKQESEEFQEMVEAEIRKRKQVMAGMHDEVNRLKQLLKQ